jgi:hypothetical protein
MLRAGQVMKMPDRLGVFGALVGRDCPPGMPASSVGDRARVIGDSDLGLCDPYYGSWSVPQPA